ncbi:AT-rich interactive domain-containing protein 2 [Hirschfeldia incana]|nr:AT-rich interactive domain-containing protein 2 [Hirschfeldia incana]
MAGWSRFNSSSCSFIDVEVQVSDECEEKLKRLFDQALLIFLEEEGNNRPLPAVLGEGKTVDLFKLFVLVREREGFESVSRKGLWDSVGERLGLDSSVSPSLRLVYSKYLDRMEKWAVEKSRIVNWDDGDSKKKGCYGGMLHELGDGFKGLLENGKCPKRNRAMAFGCRHVEESGSEFHSPGKRFKECDLDDEEVGTSCVVLSDDDSEEETLQGMLEWLTSVARCPHDPSIGVIPHCSKWKEYTGSECWIRVTRAKKALLVQRDNAEIRYQNSPFLGNQTMHPSMYEDDRRSSGRSRHSIRRPHLSIPQCNKSPVSLAKSRSSHCRDLVSVYESATDLVAGTSRATDLQVYSNEVKETSKPEIPRRYVAVGRHYQARVDEWTGGSGLDSDDTKWLGTRIWPLENREVLDRSLGKGRPDCCSCEIHTSGSVECIRFHIAEKRMELKRELGDVFFHWRFNQMGEEVSLRWTEREEKMFKKLMVSDPQSFWENAAKCFRGKKREQLVSYYFNVFLINRRRYQNRVSPRNVDSDDEGAFGCVGNGFGRDAVTLIGSDIMICSQNSQCNDFD